MTRDMTALPGATKRKTMVGRVVSDKMDKTIVVAVERLARHRVYKRVLRLTSKFKAHDEDNTARVGDRVLIEESRPMSREKRWRLVEVVTRAGTPVEMVSEEPETTEALGGPGHPGRSRAEAEEAAARAEGEAAANNGAGGAGASGGEAVADSGATGAAGEAPQAKRAVAPEPADTRADASGEGSVAEAPASGKAARK
jgi:small subunit ribosomal protein S17